MSNTSVLVTGIIDPQIGPLLRGIHIPVGFHHGKTKYKKSDEAPTEVYCYFWNGEDGIDLQGWWFGPEVGGDAVYAFHGTPKQKPPRVDWQIFRDGVLGLDKSMKISGDRIGMCTFTSEEIKECSERAADDCVKEMCQTHCSWTGQDCPRHSSKWQWEQNSKPRAERANRTRGGKRKWGE